MLRITISILAFLLLLILPNSAQEQKASYLYHEPLICEGTSLKAHKERLEQYSQLIVNSGSLVNKRGTGDVSRMVLTPDNSHMITFSSIEDWAKIWSLPKLEMVRKIVIDIFPIPTKASVVFEGKTITLSNYGRAETWNLETGESLRKGRAPKRQEVRSAASGLAAATTNGDTVVWNQKTGKTIARFPDPESKVRHLQINDQGTMIAIARESSSSKGGIVTLWRLKDKKPLVEITYDKATFNFLRFASDNSFLAAGAYNGRVILWDLKNMKHQLSFHSGDGIRSLELGPKDSLLSVAGSERFDRGVMALWDVKTGRPIMAHRSSKRIASALLDRSGKYWCFGSWDGSFGFIKYKQARIFIKNQTQ